ncbi:hypothetical protein BROC_00658 [Candidatus Brocadiaceae bacterium]|nr:hypothetical protein BROC_00658 [Candidatus Brocadiaceae bacterium]
MVFLLFASCIFIVARISQSLHNTILTPWSVYVLAWLGMLAVYSLDWITFIPIEWDTWVVLFGSLSFYLAGSIIAFRAWHSHDRPVIPNVAHWFSNVNLSAYTMFQIGISITGIAGALGYLYVIQEQYGLETLITNPGLIRATQSGEDFVAGFFWWKFLFYMNWLAIPLGVARIVYEKANSPRWIYLALLIHFLVNFILVSRSQLLLVLFLVVFVIVAAFHRRIRESEFLLIGVMLVATVVYFIVMGEALGKTFEYTISQAGNFHGPDFVRPLAQFYLYVAGNIPAFQMYMTTYESSQTYGLFQFIPIAKVLSKLDMVPWELPQEVGQNVFIPFSFNTYTYLNVFYLDWGLIGTLIGPFLFGLIGNWIYLRACSSGQVWDVIGTAFIVHASFSSIGTNVLVSTPQWEFAIALVILAVLSRKRQLRFERRTSTRAQARSPVFHR